MSGSLGAISIKRQGLALVVAFLAAVAFGLLASASPASALCKFDENKFESRLEYWRTASATEQELWDQPIPELEYYDVLDAYDAQWDIDTEAVDDWRWKTQSKFYDRRDKLIEAADLAHYYAKEKALKKVNRWYARNVDRLGEARTLKIAIAKWRRAKARLARREDARKEEVREACNGGIRGVGARARTVRQELSRHFELIGETLDHRLQLWFDQGGYPRLLRSEGL